MTTLGVFRDDFYPSTVALANTVYNSTALASGVIPVNLLGPADEVYLASSGATALTTPTAAAIYAQALAVLQAAGVLQPVVNGVNYDLRIINTNAGTLTLTAGAGVTITGPATMAANTWRDYIVTITSQGAVTLQSVGAGTAP